MVKVQDETLSRNPQLNGQQNPFNRRVNNFYKIPFERERIESNFFFKYNSISRYFLARKAYLKHWKIN